VPAGRAAGDAATGLEPAFATGVLTPGYVLST
jgi:hypothetical protein